MKLDHLSDVKLVDTPLEIMLNMPKVVTQSLGFECERESFEIGSHLSKRHLFL